MAKERHREKERKRDRKGETLNHLSIHQWVRSAIFASHQLTSPIGFPFLKLPPPPCAVLLVYDQKRKKTKNSQKKRLKPRNFGELVAYHSLSLYIYIYILVTVETNGYIYIYDMN